MDNTALRAEDTRNHFSQIYDIKSGCIADAVTADKVLIPSDYAKLHNPENDHSKDFHDPCLWSSTQLATFWKSRSTWDIPCWAGPAIQTARPTR